MADITQKLKTAVSAYAKFSNEEVRREFFLAIDELDGHLNRLEYDPSSEVERRTELLEQAIQSVVETFKSEKDEPQLKDRDEDFEVDDDKSKEFDLP